MLSLSKKPIKLMEQHTFSINGEVKETTVATFKLIVDFATLINVCGRVTNYIKTILAEKL